MYCDCDQNRFDLLFLSLDFKMIYPNTKRRVMWNPCRYLCVEPTRITPAPMRFKVQITDYISLK